MKKCRYFEFLVNAISYLHVPFMSGCIQAICGWYRTSLEILYVENLKRLSRQYALSLDETTPKFNKTFRSDQILKHPSADE